MTLNDYQGKALFYDQCPVIGGQSALYPIMGLSGESGECLEKMKKLFRDHNNEMTVEYKNEIVKELGDVFWYLAVAANKLGFSLQDIAQSNLDKLKSRKERDKIQGDGDNR